MAESAFTKFCGHRTLVLIALAGLVGFGLLQAAPAWAADPDQEWVLRELIHYLSGEASGAIGFEDMGENWVGVRKAAPDGTLRAGDVAVRDIAERWEQSTNYLSLSLLAGARRGGNVARPNRARGRGHRRSRRQTPREAKVVGLRCAREDSNLHTPSGPQGPQSSVWPRA